MRFDIFGIEIDDSTDTVIWLQSEKRAVDVARCFLKEAAKINRPLPEIIGFAGRAFPLIANLTVMENALLPVLFNCLMKTDEAKRRFDDLSKMLGLYERRFEKKSRLTERDMFMATLLRALMANPRLIFVDCSFTTIRAIDMYVKMKEALGDKKPRVFMTLVGHGSLGEGLREVCIGQ